MIFEPRGSDCVIASVTQSGLQVYFVDIEAGVFFFKIVPGGFCFCCNARAPVRSVISTGLQAECYVCSVFGGAVVRRFSPGGATFRYCKGINSL